MLMNFHLNQRKVNSTKHGASTFKDHSTLFQALIQENTLILLETMLLSRLQTVEHLNLGGLTKEQKLSNLGELDLTLCKFRVMDVETTWLFQAQILNGGNCSNMMNLNSFSPMSKIKEFYKLQTTTEKVTM
jgi:hypothetical protein